MKKTLIVCDYPNPHNFTFPNFGLGSTEKRFWQLAKTVSEFDDFKVVITGPLWLTKYLPRARHFKKRLDETTVVEFMKRFGRANYLFASSEYFDKDSKRNAFLKVADKAISYVTHPYDFKKACFDNKRSFLFCYSDGMRTHYNKQKPHKLLLFHSGVQEIPYLTLKSKNYLLWLGRIDADKSPHYAILAAKKICMPIYILGAPLQQPAYERKYAYLLNSKNVKCMGLVSGAEKMKLISEAKCGVYTCGPDFLEAGASTLGEMLCSGLPVSGISWRGDDAVCEAVNDKSLGAVYQISKNMTETQIVSGLARAIKQSLALDRRTIYDISNYRYYMPRLVREMFAIVDNH